MFGLLMIVASPHATFSIACVMAFVLLAVLITSIRTRRLQIFAGLIFALITILPLALDAAEQTRRAKTPQPEVVLALCQSWDAYVEAYGWLADFYWWLHGCEG